MKSLGFEPINKDNTAFSNGEIVIADLQKSNIVRDVEGDIRVIDADAKLHTKDVGGDYIYPPVETDLPEGTDLGGTMFRKANKNQEVFVSNAQRAVEDIKQEKATPEQWIAMLKKNGGLKAGEDKWLGLEEWLAEKGKVKGENGKTDPSAAGGSSPKTGAQSTVTKQEILDFIGENKIQIEEVRYSQFGYGLIDEATRKLEVELKEIGWDAMVEKYPGFDELFEVYNGELLWSEERASVGEYEDFIIDDKIVDLDSPTNAINETREKYTTEGLERKREIALTVPTIEPYNESDEVHFGDAGDGRAVAWVRFGETTDSEGNRVLVIDEIQSKRHQDGREKGYRGVGLAKEVLAAEEEVRKTNRELTAYREPLKEKYNFKELGSSMFERLKNFDAMLSEEERITMDALGQARNEAEKRLQELRGQERGIPSAPFEKNWHELAMKRMLRLAAEEGFDKVAWTTGEQQAERYDMSKVVSHIACDKVGKNGNKSFSMGLDYKFVVDPNGIVVSSKDEYIGKSIADIVGKPLANKMLEMQEGDTISGDGLRIGGEGMKGFYDRMLPSFVQKYTKKWGAKVGEVTMPNLGENNTMHSVDVTPEMKESVMEGQTMFRRVVDRDGNPIGDGSWHKNYKVDEVALSYPNISYKVDESASTESVYVTYTNNDPKYPENGKPKVTVRYSIHDSNAVKFGDQLRGEAVERNNGELLYRLGLKEREWIPAPSVPTRTVSKKDLENNTYEESELTERDIMLLPVGADIAEHKGKLIKGTNELILVDKVLANNNRGYYRYSDIPEVEQQRAKQLVREIVEPYAREKREEQEAKTMFRKMNKHAEEFNKTHKGGVPVVEIDPNNMEAELIEEELTVEDIQHVKERKENGVVAIYNSDKNIIYLLDPSLDKEAVYFICWHEDTHAAITAVALEPEMQEEFYSFARGKKKEDFENLLRKHGYEEEDFPEESLAYAVQAMAMLDNWSAELLSKLYGSTVKGAQRQMEIIQPLIDYINNGRQGTQSSVGEVVRDRGMYNNTANQKKTAETEGTGIGEATGGLTDGGVTEQEGETLFSKKELTPEQKKKQEALKENAKAIRRLHNVKANFSITALRYLGFALETQKQREMHDRLFAERDAMSGRENAVSVEVNPQAMTLQERITENLLKMAEQNKDNVELRLCCMRRWRIMV